jgi:hypothetical protein
VKDEINEESRLGTGKLSIDRDGVGFEETAEDYGLLVTRNGREKVGTRRSGRET